MTVTKAWILHNVAEEMGRAAYNVLTEREREYLDIFEAQNAVDVMIILLYQV